jgi:hypothetical protein
MSFYAEIPEQEGLYEENSLSGANEATKSEITTGGEEVGESSIPEKVEKKDMGNKSENRNPDMLQSRKNLMPHRYAARRKKPVIKVVKTKEEHFDANSFVAGLIGGIIIYWGLTKIFGKKKQGEQGER